MGEGKGTAKERERRNGMKEGVCWREGRGRGRGLEKGRGEATGKESGAGRGRGKRVKEGVREKRQGSPAKHQLLV